MQAGRLRHRVTLQQLVAGSPSVNAAGEPDEVWTDWKTVYASVEPLKGRELTAAQQVSAEITGKIVMRYRSGVLPTMRAVFESRYYNILAIVDPEERHRELTLYTSQGLNEG